MTPSYEEQFRVGGRGAVPPVFVCFEHQIFRRDEGKDKGCVLGLEEI